MASVAKACFSSKVEYHAVIPYLYLKGKIGKEIHGFRLKDDFLLHLVTVDETWIHYYEPENKAQSCQWVGHGSLRPKKFKTQPSAGKVMAAVFWEAKGVITGMLYFLPKRSIITGVYYVNLLCQLRTAIREKR